MVQSPAHGAHHGLGHPSARRLARPGTPGTMPRMDQIPMWVLGVGALVLIGLIVLFFKIRQK